MSIQLFPGGKNRQAALISDAGEIVAAFDEWAIGNAVTLKSFLKISRSHVYMEDELGSRRFCRNQKFPDLLFRINNSISLVFNFEKDCLHVKSGTTDYIIGPGRSEEEISRSPGREYPELIRMIEELDILCLELHKLRSTSSCGKMKEISRSSVKFSTERDLRLKLLKLNPPISREKLIRKISGKFPQFRELPEFPVSLLPMISQNSLAEKLKSTGLLVVFVFASFARESSSTLRAFANRMHLTADEKKFPGQLVGIEATEDSWFLKNLPVKIHRLPGCFVFRNGQYIPDLEICTSDVRVRIDPVSAKPRVLIFEPEISRQFAIEKAVKRNGISADLSINWDDAKKLASSANPPYGIFIFHGLTDQVYAFSEILEICSRRRGSAGFVSFAFEGEHQAEIANHRLRFPPSPDGFRVALQKFPEISRSRHHQVGMTADDFFRKLSACLIFCVFHLKMTEVYWIRNSNEDLGDFKFPGFKLMSVTDSKRMLVNHPSAVKELWAQKNRIDEAGNFFSSARDRIFPSSTTGSELNKNRAGDKLDEISRSVPLLDLGTESPVFLDLCGAPGAFSLLVMKKFPGSRGFGLSLRGTIDWYPELESTNFQVEWGKDGQGDLFNAETRGILKDRIDGGCELILADGGFSISGETTNFQELLTARLILTEALSAVQNLKKSGNFLLKMYDTFSYLSASLIFVISRFFEKCCIVKPQRSRVTNSERYLMGLNFKGDESRNFQVLVDSLEKAVLSCTTTETPESIIPLEFLKSDKLFSKDLEISSLDIADRQADALRLVLDEASRASRKKPRLEK